MGEFISTGVGQRGHETDLVYEGINEDKKCFMVCRCGWRVEIKAFRNYGVVIETRIRYDEHLENLGLRRMHPKPKNISEQ